MTNKPIGMNLNNTCTAKLSFYEQPFGKLVRDVPTRTGAIYLEYLFSSHIFQNQLLVQIQYNGYTG
jgi:hypothetical protein